MAWVCGWGGLIMQKKGFTQPSLKDDEAGNCGFLITSSVLRESIDRRRRLFTEAYSCANT